MAVPDFTTKMPPTSTTRKLMTLNDIDVQRDIIDFKFICYSDLLTNNFTYTMEIKSWTKDKF